MRSWEVREGFLEEGLCRGSWKGAGQTKWWEPCVRQRAQQEQGLGGDTECRLPGKLVAGSVLRGAGARWGLSGAWGEGGLTFIMSTMVLRAIMAMMVYSKGGDTTNCHIRYWKLCLFWGICRVRGLALMAKSMQALCGTERSGVRA